MPKNKTEKKLTSDTILKALSTIYDKTKTGIPLISKPVDELAAEYLKKYPIKSVAAKRMLNVQVAKCTTSGFITGFGGFITMPITIPADISSVLYVQMRMIACTACIAGYDVNDDEVQTLVFACLAGVSINQIAKDFGIKFGAKIAEEGIKKIPGKALTKINQRVGFRFLTKFGEKGLINLGKMIPIVGAVINGGFDLAETKIIAVRAYKMFIKNDFSVSEIKTDDVINVEVEDVEDNIEQFDSSDNNDPPCDFE